MLLRSMLPTLNFIKSHDRSQLRILPGLRNALGVVLAIVVGMVTGNLLAGLAVAIGAQVAGFAGLNGTARKRIRTMLFAAFWMAITTFLGAMTGGTLWAIVTVTTLGFIAGLLVCVSNEAGLIGLWATIALIFITGFHASPSSALNDALFVLTGGLLQTLLMIASDLLLPSKAETSAVVAAFVANAHYATSGSREADLQVASALLEADARLRDSFINPTRWNQLRTLLDLAESVRIEVVALHGLSRWPGEKTEGTAVLQDLNSARVHIADLLSAIATSLTAGTQLTIDWQEHMSALHMISERSRNESVPRDWMHAYACIDHAYRELMQVPRLLHQQQSLWGPWSPEKWVRSPIPQLQSAYEAIRVNLTFQSATFRHAVRLGVTLGMATLIYRFVPFTRGYWLPLTTLVILKPEFTTTFSRGVARVLGTLVGSLLATWLLAIPDPTHVLGVVLIGLFLWGMYTVLNYNMVLFSCILTAEVVVLVSFFQNSPLLMTIVDRAVYTVAGSLLAFAAYLLWPTWHHRNVPDALAKLISTQRTYLYSIFAGCDISHVTSYRKQTRLSRTNAVYLVNQAMTEPVTGSWDEQATRGMMTTLHRFSDALLSLEAYLVHGHGELRWHADLVQFGQYVDRCLLEIEADVNDSKEHTFLRSTLTEVERPEGTLDEVSPYTKQELLGLDVPGSLASILIRIEDNLSTMFRIVSSLRNDRT